MHSMQEALQILSEVRTNTDEQIVDLHESISHKERELEGKKRRLRELQERSASLSQTISFVKGDSSEKKHDISDEDAEKLEKDFGGKDPVYDLATAILQMRDYVQPDVKLPAETGWSWYDALKAHAPDLLNVVLISEEASKARGEARLNETPEYSHAPGELVPEDYVEYEDNIIDAMPDTSVSNLTEEKS